MLALSTAKAQLAAELAVATSKSLCLAESEKLREALDAMERCFRAMTERVAEMKDALKASNVVIEQLQAASAETKSFMMPSLKSQVHGYCSCRSFGDR